jgi:sugar phosphate isomerase/epimerase
MTTNAARRRLALQLYTVRRELEAAPEKTLERVRALGIDAVEVAPLPEGLSPRRLGELLRACALEVVAIHGELPLAESASRAVESAETFGCRRLIWHGWPRDAAFDNVGGLDLLIDRYNQAAETARRLGLELGLHSHWWEFETISGILPYRQFLQKLDPSIFFEIDVYWVRTAGCDPLKVLQEFGRRLKMLHLKDGPARHGFPMTALGEGVVDLQGILRHLPAAVDSLVLEMDECASDIWIAIERSIEFFQQLAACGR